MILPDLAGLAADIATLSLLPGNPRVGDVDAVAASLTAFGQRKPIVAKRDGTVVAGNHTLQAAQQLGWSEIAVVWVDDDDTTAKAFALADNRTAELGGYDDVALEAMVRDVLEFDAELLADIGWAGEDLEALLASVDIEELPPTEADPDAVPAVPSDPVTKRGDVWLLGPHRLICGDCRDFGDIERLMAGNAANVVFTSPPYAEQREYDQSSGFRPIKPDEYVDWWEDLQANVRSVLAADGSFFVNIRAHAVDGQRHLYVHDLVAAHVRRWGWLFVDDLCWVDTKNGVPGGWPNRFKDAWEPVYHFATNRQIKFRPFANGVESGDVFEYSAATAKSMTGSGLLGEKATEAHDGLARPSNVIQVAASSASVGHAAAFPVGLPEWFIKSYSDEGDHVLDPFMGSGSTLLASHQTGRIGYGSELSPAYCDVICRRFQRHTGIVPVLEATGRPHDFEADQ